MSHHRIRLNFFNFGLFFSENTFCYKTNFKSENIFRTTMHSQTKEEKKRKEKKEKLPQNSKK